jgi:hypothetical protein
MLDQLAPQQATYGDQARAAATARSDRAVEDPVEGGHIAGCAVDAGQERAELSGPTDHAHHGGDQVAVAALADGPAGLQPRRHGHDHPEPPANRLGVQLVGLDVAQLTPTWRI